MVVVGPASLDESEPPLVPRGHELEGPARETLEPFVAALNFR